MQTSPTLGHHLATDWSARPFVAFWGALIAVDVTRALPFALQLVALATVAALCSRHQAWPSVAVVAAVVWLIGVGFVLNAGGALAPVAALPALLLGGCLLIVSEVASR